MNTQNETFKFGWIPDLPDHRDVLYSAPLKWLQTLPSNIDLRASCPVVYNQGQLGSCTSNAVGAAFQFTQKKQHIPDFTPSRLFIYYNIRRMMGTVPSDSGASIRNGMKTMANEGICAEMRWPYDITRFTSMPVQDCYDKALTNQALAYSSIDNTRLSQLKTCIYEGFPFVFGFTVYESFMTIGADGVMPMPQPDESTLGGHAVMAVGYDDAKQVFIVRNSWGTQWGDHGYFYMPYTFITDLGYARDFWTLRLVEEGLQLVAGVPAAATVEASNGQSVDYRVKQAILIVSGNPSVDPDKLSETKEMADFGFNDMQYVDLTDRFNNIRRAEGNSTEVSFDDVSDCEKVKDCIELVNS